MAITAVLQIVYYKKTGKRVQFSPTWGAVMWRSDVEGQKNMASLVTDSAIPAMIDVGAVLTEDLPELMENPEAYECVKARPELKDKVLHVVDGFEKINNGSREARIEAIKTALYENMLPIVAVVKEKKSSHCVPIIGWDDNKECFHVMNSWGNGITAYKYKNIKRAYRLIPAESKGENIMHKIALDPGHGLLTSGKQTPDGIKEWTLNDAVRDKVVKLLEPYNVGIINLDNNEGNVDEPLNERLKKYLNAGAEAMVSIHHNAYSGNWNNATGVEVYTDRNSTNEDLRLADCIYGRLTNYTGLTGRGIKQANFAVINQNKIPAVLVEGGFMDGTEDYKVITSEAGQEAYARAVAEGLIEFMSLEKKNVFTDIENHWAKDTINLLAEKGIIAGRGDGTFDPDGTITRAEVAVMIARAMGLC
jgi:N-acetylmuramoyl-L-alanine amidase